MILLHVAYKEVVHSLNRKCELNDYSSALRFIKVNLAFRHGRSDKS